MRCAPDLQCNRPAICVTDMTHDLEPVLTRIAEALERLAPAERPTPNFTGARLFRHDTTSGAFRPAPDYPLPLAVLIGVGSLGSALVLWRLGKSFSILPEARKLVTGGPYAYVRHPLYSVEIITILGTALQFAAPWSWIIAVIVVVLLWIRSHFEEQVLAESFPEYADYRQRTKRFIPGII